MVAIYNTSLSATSQRHFSDGLGGVLLRSKMQDMKYNKLIIKTREFLLLHI